MNTIPILSLKLAREQTIELPRTHCTHQEAALAVARHVLQDSPIEKLIAILVDGQTRITAVVLIAQGGIHGTSVTARDVLRPVLVHQASAFILAHNHPSGNVSPSREDLETTKHIAAAADMVGVQLLDHLIITEREHSHIPF